MFETYDSDRTLAEVICRYTTATAKDLRRLSNIAAIAAEIKQAQETGKIPSPAPIK